MEFTETYPSTSTVRWCRRYTSGIHAGNGFRCKRSTANSSRGTARIYFLEVALTRSHHWRAWTASEIWRETCSRTLPLGYNGNQSTAGPGTGGGIRSAKGRAVKEIGRGP